MKKLILGIALAASLITQAQADDKAKVCADLSEMGRSVMQFRQINGPYTKMMEIAGSNKALIAMVDDAYDKPAYSGKKYQQKAVDEFVNYVAVICFRNYKGK